jgi:hypothetical protein
MGFSPRSTGNPSVVLVYLLDRPSSGIPVKLKKNNGGRGMNRKNISRLSTGCLLLALLSFGNIRAAQAQLATESSSGATEDAQGLPSKPQPTNQYVTPPMPLTFRERTGIYIHSISSAEFIIGPLAGAAIGQWENKPAGWGQGAAGYGRRAASGYGRSLISNTFRFGVAAIDGEDPRTSRTSERGMWPKVRHGITGVFISQRENGGQMPAISRFVGIYGAAFISNSWYPAGENGVPDALKRGSITVASTVGWHVFNEFWPDISKTLHFHRK